MPISIMRRQEVEARTGMKKSTIYKMMAEGRFPKPVKLSERSIGWVESEIEAWMRSRINARD